MKEQQQKRLNSVMFTARLNDKVATSSTYPSPPGVLGGRRDTLSLQGHPAGVCTPPCWGLLASRLLFPLVGFTEPGLFCLMGSKRNL